MPKKLAISSVCLLLLSGLALTDGQAWSADCDEECKPQTLLFVDDAEVMYRPGTKRVLRPLDKHPANPVLPDDQPWERTIAYTSAYRDPETGQYQLWYQAYGGPLGTCVCYATSQDGLSWNKPALDIHPIKGEKTNIVLTGPGHYGASVLVDPRDPDPKRRYKMAFWQRPKGKTYGLGVAFSPDGIHWDKHPGTPLLKAYPGVCHTVSDVIDVMYDPPRNVYAIYGKTWIDGPLGKQWKRANIRTQSRDFVNWSRPRLVMATDEFDGWEGDELELKMSDVGGGSKGIQLHGAPVFYYKGVYLALVQKMDARLTGRMPTELAVSRDGLRWHRPFRDTPFIASPDRDEFGSCIWSSATPIFLGDEIRFYFGAYSGRWSGGRENFLSKPTGIGLATMPRDRFAGIRPIEKIGQITLTPKLLERTARLTLNADAGQGTIRMEVLDEDGQTVEKFSRKAATPMKGDKLAHEVSWKESSISDLPAGRYWLRIYLEGDAVAYALTIHPMQNQ